MLETSPPRRPKPAHAFAMAVALALPAIQAAADITFAQMRPPRWPMPSQAKLQTEDVRGPTAPVLGDSNAPVSVVVFSDYYCPYCRTLSSTLTQLLDKYPQQVRIVYRHFATSPETQSLAQAALCAAEQNRFHEYHSLIFSTRGVGPQSVGELAAKLDLDAGAFDECVLSKRYEQRVVEDIKEGDRLAIEVTPTLFVNGQRIVGAATLDSLSARVEQALAR